MTTTENPVEPKRGIGDWILRLIKGTLAGIGGIVPGLSGGVLLVVFGIYEPLMQFLGHLRVNFWKNVHYFLPVVIGLGLGILGFSVVIDFAFTHYAAQFTWLFIGFIAGTFPSLFKTAGKQGRKAWHWVLLGGMSVGTFFLMRWMETVQNTKLEPTFFNWLLSGAMVGLGVVIPGMSPSNFLMYLDLYLPMASGIKDLNFGVIVPLALGVILCILLFAKLVSWLFKKFYAFMYHFILGIVVGSTAAIIPADVQGWTIGVCALMAMAGAVVSFFVAKLDEKYARE